MNGQDLRTRLRVRYRDPDAAVYSDAEYQDYLNEAYRVVLLDACGPLLEAKANLTYVAGDASETLPTDVLAVQSVRNTTDGWLLRPFAHHTQLREQGFYPDQTGDIATGPPVFYRLFGSTVEVFPQPTAQTVVQVEYQVYPGDVAAGSEPIFPEPHHSLLIDGALAAVYLDNGNLDSFGVHEARFRAGITRLANALGARDDGYHAIAVEY